MAEPALDQVRRNPCLESRNSESVPKPFRHGARSSDMSSYHHFLHPAPSSRAAPRPQPPLRSQRITLRGPCGGPPIGLDQVTAGAPSASALPAAPGICLVCVSGKSLWATEIRLLVSPNRLTVRM
jgi:hypothetical protein